MANRLPAGNQCPYWSEDRKNCTVCSGGLFIPLDDHIATFCTTEIHRNCPRYHFETTSSTLCHRLNRKADRRRHSRFSRKLPVQLILLNAAGNVIYRLSESADTIDLSKGGMQISSVEPLADASYISFSFDRTFPPELQSSIGRVKWCRYEKQAHRYMAGLAFQNEQTAKAVSSCIKPVPN